MINIHVLIGSLQCLDYTLARGKGAGGGGEVGEMGASVIVSTRKVVKCGPASKAQWWSMDL